MTARRTGRRGGRRYARSVQPVGSTHRNLRQVVADEIHGMIMRGELGPGERLVEEKLAEQLGVSRNPVREAIRLLESTGLVEVRPRRGAYVSSVDVDDLREVLAVRGLIEGHAAELAAGRAGPGDVAAIDGWIERGEAATAAGDPLGAAACHRGFHLAVEEAGGNRYLGVAAGPLRSRTEMVFSLLLPERGPVSWAEHRAIRDAIAGGDGPEARRCVERHLERVLAQLESRDRRS